MISPLGLGPGTVLDGKYEILNRLGGGGMGEVFKVRHLHLDAFRCIKVMKEGMLGDDDYHARFLREARLATQIHHPNIAVVHDFFFGDGRSYMVTEFIDGTTVRQWSSAHGRFPLALAADVAVQVLAGLDHIHRRGLLHRDISTDNVMLSYDAEEHLIAKIIDLGIAKNVRAPSFATTQVGMLIGNPKYMSPEQLGGLEDGEQLDGRSDLYGLGVVLYEMLLGVPPFEADTPHGYIVKHLTQQPPSFRDAIADSDLPAGIEAVIFHALEKERSDRFADAREMAAALQPFLSAPVGTLTRDAVNQIRRGPEETFGLNDVASAGAKKTDDQATIKAFLENLEQHSDDPDSTEAKERLFERSLIETVRTKEAEGDRMALQRLAEGHPPGSLVGDAARDALARVWRRQDEDNAFQQIWETGTSAAWQQFIDAHPGSTHAEEARRCRQEASDFEGALTIDTLGIWRAFLKSWPEGRHRLDAEIRLRARK